MREIFRRIATRVSTAAGRASTFLLAVIVVIIWAVSGPVFNFSDTWQLVINTGTTIVTFLMVFLIQNTQNRDGKAVQIKLDELIRATRANDRYISIEDLSDEELTKLNERFSRMRASEVEQDLALEKLHQRLSHVLNRRISIPGEQVVSKLNPFSDRSGKKTDKK